MHYWKELKPGIILIPLTYTLTHLMTALSTFSSPESFPDVFFFCHESWYVMKSSVFTVFKSPKIYASRASNIKLVLKFLAFYDAKKELLKNTRLVWVYSSASRNSVSSQKFWLGILTRFFKPKLPTHFSESKFQVETSESELLSRYFQVDTSKLILPSRYFRLENSDSKIPTRNSDLKFWLEIPTGKLWLISSDSKVPTRKFRLESSDSKVPTRKFRLGIPCQSFGSESKLLTWVNSFDLQMNRPFVSWIKTNLTGKIKHVTVHTFASLNQSNFVKQTNLTEKVDLRVKLHCGNLNLLPCEPTCSCYSVTCLLGSARSSAVVLVICLNYWIKPLPV